MTFETLVPSAWFPKQIRQALFQVKGFPATQAALHSARAAGVAGIGTCILAQCRFFYNLPPKLVGCMVGWLASWRHGWIERCTCNFAFFKVLPPCWPRWSIARSQPWLAKKATFMYMKRTLSFFFAQPITYRLNWSPVGIRVYTERIERYYYEMLTAT